VKPTTVVTYYSRLYSQQKCGFEVSISRSGTGASWSHLKLEWNPQKNWNFCCWGCKAGYPIHMTTPPYPWEKTRPTMVAEALSALGPGLVG